MEKTPKIFSHSRPNLTKLYEILRAAEKPLPRTRIFQTANTNQQTDKPLFYWLLEQGFLEKIESGWRSSKGIFRITAKGRDARKAYETLFDIMGMSDEVQMRFPVNMVSVKTRPFSGQKVRM